MKPLIFLVLAGLGLQFSTLLAQGAQPLNPQAQTCRLATGIYDVQLRIGDRIVSDVLEVLRASGGKISGFYEVPRTFRVPIQGTVSADGCQLSASFEAQENGETYTVILEGSVGKPGRPSTRIDGVLKLGDGTVLGPFNAKRRQ